MRKLKRFTFEGKRYQVRYVETETLLNGTVADVYEFVGDDTKDLAIFTTKTRTPLQRVLQGDRTVEGYISGEVRLTITKPDSTVKVFTVGKDKLQSLSVDVEVGDLMQWEVLEGSTLVGYEVCFPPYEPCRYEDVGY